jgi:hypothetical protein
MFYLFNAHIDEVTLRENQARGRGDRSLNLQSKILWNWVVDDEDEVRGLVGK